MTTLASIHAALSLTVAVLAAPQAQAEAPLRRDTITAGWIEDAWIGEPGARLAAKLDTGAETSSLDARYRILRRDGIERAAFEIEVGAGRRRTIEADVVRWTRVRRAGAAVDRRPVITLPLCVAGASGITEFTLADRSGLDYPVLIGRSFLAGRIVVDAGKERTGDVLCPAQAAR